MPVTLTLAGLMAERLTQAFWPLWTVLFFAIAPLILGWGVVYVLQFIGYIFLLGR